MCFCLVFFYCFPFKVKHILQKQEGHCCAHAMFLFPVLTPCLAECSRRSQLAAGGKRAIHSPALCFPNREPEERSCHRPGSNVVPGSKPRPRRTLEQSSSSLPRPAQSARRRNPPSRTLLPLVPSLSQSSAVGSIEEVIRGTRL